MKAYKLIEFFGDIVTVTVGNPYTDDHLTEGELDRISDRFLVMIMEEKARMYAASKSARTDSSLTDNA